MRLRQWFQGLCYEQWSVWPDTAYRQASYRQRLSAVQEHLAESLNVAPAGSVRILSICAGDGRDVIGVLESHRRRTDVTAWLVEQSRQSVSAGVSSAKTAGLESAVHFLNTDATVYATYKGIAPADIVLLCGVWGHVPAAERTDVVRALACLCKPGGTVIWTRRVSKGMIRLHQIQSLFAAPSWEQASLNLTPDNNWAVAAYRYCGASQALPEGEQIFHFEAGAGTR